MGGKSLKKGWKYAPIFIYLGILIKTTNVMTDKLKSLLQDFILMMDDATLNYDFDSLSKEEQENAIKWMKGYIEGYFK